MSYIADNVRSLPAKQRFVKVCQLTSKKEIFNTKKCYLIKYKAFRKLRVPILKVKIIFKPPRIFKISTSERDHINCHRMFISL